MKERSLIFLILAGLVSLSLGCALVNAATDPDRMRLESVDVTPAGEGGKMTASVAIPAHNNADNMTCYIPTADGKSREVYNQKVPGQDKSSILTFDFTVTEPGKYKLYCTPRTLMISVKTEFTVEAPAEEPPPAVEPQPGGTTTKITSVGRMTYYSGEYSCTSSQDVIFIAKPDGSAYLSSTGVNFVDHINCTKSSTAVTYNFEGTADAAAGTASFTSCNEGGFNGKGSLTYDFASLSLRGEMSCWYNRGDSAGKIAVKLSLP